MSKERWWDDNEEKFMRTFDCWMHDAPGLRIKTMRRRHERH